MRWEEGIEGVLYFFNVVKCVVGVYLIGGFYLEWLVVG